jgi:glucokinase
MDGKVLIGVDIGGTKTAVSACAQPPALLQRIEFSTQPSHGPEHAIRRIIDAAREILASLQLGQQDIQSIGTSCGSPLDPIQGVIQTPPNLPTWKGVPIKSILTGAFAVDVFVENDANAGALAEFSFGAGRGTRNMVFLTMGTGLGARLILDGRLYRGASYAAGEIGHVRLTRSGPSGYHKTGSAEGWASGAGMACTAARYLQSSVSRRRPTVLTSILQNNGAQLPRIRSGVLRKPVTL